MNDKERWRWVVGWKGYYLISSFGRVKSVARTIQRSDGTHDRIKSRLLRPWSIRSGHLNVTLYRSGKRKNRLIHQLVMEAFVGPRPKGMEVRHFPDRDPTNNRLDNLQYGTRKENTADQTIHGTRPDNRGEKSGMAKLTEEKVREIRQLCTKKSQTLAKIGKMFGVTGATIGHIRSRKTWGHLT